MSQTPGQTATAPRRAAAVTPAPGAPRTPRAPRTARAPRAGRVPRFRDLLTYARPHRTALGVAVTLALVTNLAMLAQPMITGSILRAITERDPVTGLVALLAGVFVGGALVAGLQSYLVSRVGEAVVRGLRIGLGAHLLRLPVALHDRYRAGDLLSRVNSDTALLRSSLTGGPISAFAGALMLAGGLVLMAVVDWLLLLVTIGTVLFTFACIAVIVPMVRQSAIQGQEGIGHLTAALDRGLRAIRTVKSSRAEERETRIITEQAGVAYAAGVRIGTIQALINPTVTLGMQGSFLLVLGIGGQRAATGGLPLADLVTFLLLLTTLIIPLFSIVRFFSELSKGLAAYERITEILSHVPEPGDGQAQPEQPPPPGAAAGVSLEDVTFAYNADRPVLAGVSVTVPPGTRTAIVGPSGAGKTTVLSLIERFYAPTGGRVLLDGADVAGLPLSQLREMVAYVEQQAPVLAGTVRDNLCYAWPQAGDEAVARVLDQVGLTRLVARLPDGLDTDVGDAGELLSGGERQRVAIARALLGGPRVLLLDEATSQLDALTEQALRATIQHVTGPHCTVIVVAHRLSTVVDADQIVLLRDGTVEGAGTHTTLLEASETYRQLVAGQLFEGAPTAAATAAAAPAPASAADPA